MDSKLYCFTIVYFDETIGDKLLVENGIVAAEDIGAAANIISERYTDSAFEARIDKLQIIPIDENILIFNPEIMVSESQGTSYEQSDDVLSSIIMFS